jgi:hypothetical protein
MVNANSDDVQSQGRPLKPGGLARMVNANSDDVQSQGRPLKPGGLAGTRKILFADNLMEMLVENY